MTRPGAPAGPDSPAEALELPAGAVPFLLRYVRRHLRLSLPLLAIVTGAALCAVAAQYGLKLLVDGMTAPGPARRDAQPRPIPRAPGRGKRALAAGRLFGQTGATPGPAVYHPVP